MNGLDITLLAIMAVSILLGVMSGLVIQLFNILILLLGIFLAGHLSGPLGGFFARAGWDEHTCRIVAFILIFLIIALGLRFAAFFLRGWVKKLRFGKWDRILGGAVGAVKGYLICVAIFLCAVQMESSSMVDSLR